MAQQSSQQEWSLLYYRKKAQFNQYVQFKAKSFQYQKVLGKLHYLNNDDEETQRKQIKQLLINLNEAMDEMRNIFSEIYQQMKFLKLQNFASLIQGVQQLITSVHTYTIDDFKRRLQYSLKDKNKQEDIDMGTCKKCLGSINQLNLKRLYDEITTTQSNGENQKQKMTRQERRKMISQLDQYDILLAEKENYLRKVNSLLQKKGRVGELSNHDKTYNFLSQYLSKIEKIQQRRNKSYNKDPNTDGEDRKWEEESYKQILEYIKRVLFEHFVNQCSGPVKKMFQKINIDKLFKSFGDHSHDEYAGERQSIMQNHQTQTVTIPEMQQLKLIEKKFDFKVKEIAMLKTNKEELQKKYLTCLDQNRKVESDMFEIKKERKWFESEMKIAQQNLKNMTQKYQSAVKNYEEDQRKTIERYINERERILRASKIMETDFTALEEQHKKCQNGRNKAKEYESTETQTVEQQFPEQPQQEEAVQVVEAPQSRRRKSKMNKMLFNSLTGDRRNGIFAKQGEKGLLSMFEAYSQNTIPEKDQNGNLVQKKLSLDSHKIDLTVEPQLWYEEQQDDPFLQGKFKTKLKQHNSMKRLNRGRSSQQQGEHFMSFQRTLTQGNELRAYGDNGNYKHMKMSVNGFRRQQQNNNTIKQLEQVSQQSQKSPYKLSKFSGARFTEGCSDTLSMMKSLGYNTTSPEFYAEMRRRQAENRCDYKNMGFMVSDRLYKQRNRKDSKELPFERVIENGKEKFYIKKISRESTNYKLEKEKMKQISQILKPYVYNNNNLGPSPPKMNESETKTDIKSIRQRLTWLGQKRFSKERKSYISHQKQQRSNPNFDDLKMDLPHPIRNIGHEVLTVQQIVQSEYAYLKAVGFIDFLMKIGKENKKMVKTINNIQHQVKEKFKSPKEQDLDLFGGRQQAENYTRGKNFWTLDDMKDNIMIYNKNDGLSIKVQKYFHLLKRANPELYGILIVFLTDPIFAVFGQRLPNSETHLHRPDDINFVRDLFNQLQKFHKIKHNQCTHIIDFLQKIGFYKYTYF